MKGQDLLDRSMIRLASEVIGFNVPEPFYRGFPESVRNLTREQLLVDQILSYIITYGLGCFEEPRHSLMEKTFKRVCFNYREPIHKFTVLTEAQAEEKLAQMAEDLFASSHPLSNQQYEFVKSYCREYDYLPEKYDSKNTAIRLLCDTRDSRFAKPLRMSDVIELIDEIECSRSETHDGNLHKLNLGLDSSERIAGSRGVSFLMDYMDVSNNYNLRDLMSMCASGILEDPMEADTVVSDEVLELPEGTEQIRSVDTERIIALMNM